MKVLKETGLVIIFSFILRSCLCIEDFDRENCKDRFGASLTENFALLKPTWQTSTKGDANSSRAADGNTNPYFSDDSCSETESADNLVWQVDLQSEIYVTSVAITTRADQHWKDSDFFVIYVLNTLGGSTEEWKCAEGFFPNTGETISVACYMPKKSNLVEVRLVKPEGTLSLCEVEVFGRKLDYYEKEVNFALRQLGKQSSIHFDKKYFPPGLALDGNRSYGLWDSCMHTGISPSPSWWSVDLGKLITVNAVTITSPNHGAPQRIAKFDIRVGSAQNAEDEDYENCVGLVLGFGLAETRTLFCTNPIRGRYVTIVSLVNKYFHLCEVSVHGEEPECTAPQPLGMETFKILASQLAASSRYNEAWGPEYGRLNIGSGKVWATSVADTAPWLQVDFLWIVTVTGILTQGRFDHDQWVTTFSVASKVDGMDFQFYVEEGKKKIFTANTDRNSIVRQTLWPAIVARWIRVHPVTWHGSHVSLRLELIGCQNRLEGSRPPQALGMTNGKILEAQLTASSHDAGWEPHKARLNLDLNGWAATTPLGSWLQVDFMMVAVVLEIKTQGSHTGPAWVKEFQVSYGSFSKHFSPYTENAVNKTFVANVNQGSPVTQSLSPAIVARLIRIHPTSWQDKTGLRAEFIGYYRESSTERPLGMQDRFIRDSQISASTQHNHVKYFASSGRLNPGVGNGDHSWVPHHGNAEQWFQVDFLRLTKVTKIMTQGRPTGNKHWVTSYELSFGADGLNFHTYKRNGKAKVFLGNWDHVSISSQIVSPAIVSRFIRIYPRTKSKENAMRVEFVGSYIGFRESCQTARGLGMEDGRINARQLSASSQHSNTGKPEYGRLNAKFVSGVSEGCWISGGPPDNLQWFQVEFKMIVKLVEIHTQGRPSSDQWVKEYKVSYSIKPNHIDHQFYQQHEETKVFQANTDSESVARNSLFPAIVAKIVRLHIHSWNNWISLRVEFVGSYEAPHGPALIDADFVSLENRLTASSFLDQRHRPIHGIISDRVNVTSWTPATESVGEFIQVDLLQLTPISGVGLRSGGDQPVNDSYTEVIMKYSNTEGSWRTKKDYLGKTMTFLTSDCYTEFEKLLVARYVRLVITGWGTRTGFLFQLYGTTEFRKASAGIEDGSIKDDQMKSSNHPDDPYPAHEARLNYLGAWCGNTLRRNLFLQVDFHSNFQVHAVATEAKSVGIMESVTHYKISSSLNDVHWSLYEEEGLVRIFHGNTSCQCSRKHSVKPFLVRSLRFLPTSWESRPCIRVDVYGTYKGILQIHVRSGAVLDQYGMELTRECSIKLNGEEVSESKDGINVVVASYITGDLVSSNSSKYSQLNDLLKDIKDDSVVVLATQNVNQRPPEETLHILESLGGINLRYSLTSEHANWILVGYKGKHKVDWISVKFGKKGEAATRVSSTVRLNQRPTGATKPVFHEHYMSSENTNGNDSDLSLAGRHSLLVHNVSARCGLNEANCQAELSLAMWMKQEMPRVNVHTSSTTPKAERFVLKYYSNGYNYIIPPYEMNWYDSRSHCLTLGMDLVVMLDQHTEHAIDYMLQRAGVSVQINLGLQRHPITSNFQWVDGSPLEYTHWFSTKPDNGKCVSRFSNKEWDSLDCFAYLRPFMCQQPIEGLTGLVPMGVEHETIPDKLMKSSTKVGGDDAFYGRANSRRNTANGWCADYVDDEPWLQLDLGRIRTICGVGTQGRGSEVSVYPAWPQSYSVKLSNDTLTWKFVKHEGSNKVFQANEDENTMVINRFHEPTIAQIIRVEFLKWNDPQTCCGRMEVFACSNGGREKEERKTKTTQTQDVRSTVTESEAEDCMDLLMSGKTTDGVYMINPGSKGPFPVYCDQTTDGGGWMLIQRRHDGSVDFYRSFEEYSAGFGDLAGDHWLGLSRIAAFTRSYPTDLRIDLKKFDDSTRHIVYSGFTVDDLRWAYKLRAGVNLGSGDDGFVDHWNGEFNTKDKGTFQSTAHNYKTGWWFTKTSRKSNLNGGFYTSKAGPVDGMKWTPWTVEVLKEAKMMMRWNGKGKQGLLELSDWFTYSGDPVVYQAVQAKLNDISFWTMNNPVFLTGDFFRSRHLTHISTQGGTNKHFVKQYYLKLNDNDWWDYKENGVLKIFEGNNERTLGDASHIVSNCLKETQAARMMRIYPTSCEGSCSLRIQVYSCVESCSKPVGVQHSSKIPNYNMFASSNTYNGNPHRGRLHHTQLQWTSKKVKVNEFLEIRLLELFKVTSVATQGGEDCWVKSFSISYRDEKIKWKHYKGKNGAILPGNRNPRAVVRSHFDSPFLAHSVRFIAKTWFNKICMRTEIYGCPTDNPVFVVNSMTAVVGKNVLLSGRYRYCEHSECPGCLKSLWLRAFGKHHLVADHFLYDCQYHQFQVTVQASSVPGIHKIHMGASENTKIIPDESLVNELLVGTVTLTQEYTSCLDLLLSGHTKSGVYKIEPDSETPFEVYCDQETYGGGWTLIQRHINDDEDFDRVWADYKNGFGDLNANFWLGNDHIHRLTTTKRELLLDLNSIAGDHAFILYKSFQVKGETEHYRLSVSEYEQSVGDCMDFVNGMKFSTKDRDHDLSNTINCAEDRQAGWWYNTCINCHLNGLFNKSEGILQWDKVRMDEWTDNRYLDKVDMKIREKYVVTCSDQYCYYVLKSPLHWNFALEKCRSFNADLLSVRDADENQWIVNNILKKHAINRVHLGIRNLTYWTDGGSFVYSNFPTPRLGNGCPYLRMDGVWDVGDCVTQSHIICKRAKFCYMESCHVFTTEKMNYNAAEGYCRDIGYNIVKINSIKKNEYIVNVLKSLTMDSDWITPFLGLRRGSTGYRWYDDERPGLENWKPGEPDEPDSKDCVKIGENTGLWADSSCTAVFAPVCEKVLSPKRIPTDCLDLLMTGSVRSGIYTIDPDGEGPIPAYCDQESLGGGWTVLMRHFDNSFSFNNKWELYREGLNKLFGNFWLGNNNIHKLTRVGSEVLFDLKSDSGEKAFVHYKTFKVADESDSYRLTIGDFQPSEAGDGMAEHNNMLFSTVDRDNDLDSGNCANVTKGAWWYNSCGPVTLTAYYGNDASQRKMRWGTWTGNEIINKAEMKTRSKSVVSCNNQFCYYSTNKERNWIQALYECRRLNADLISVHNEIDNQWIIDNILTPQSLDEVYIGLGVEHVEKWTDESPVSFTKLSGVISGGKCVVLKRDGSWTMVDCDQAKHVLCKRGKFCFKGDCYVRGTESANYSACEDYCQTFGYNLVKISNEQENKYLVDLIRASSVIDMFIGLTLVNGKYQWPDSTKLQYSSKLQFSGTDLAPEPFIRIMADYGQWKDSFSFNTKIPLCEQGPVVNSCAEVLRHGRRESGFYSVSEGGTKLFKVYCDLTSASGPWTVLQRRLFSSGMPDFHSKSWANYTNGFKSDEMNFWLGNKYIHQLTKTPQRLKIVIYTEEDNVYEAVYEDFTVKDEASGFQVDFGTYSGSAGDSFSKHRGRKFSTVDKDLSGSSCTSSHPGGWWFADCLDSNLNGQFVAPNNSNGTIFWRSFKELIIRTEIKIQQYDEVPDTQFSGIIRTENISLGLAFTSDATEVKVRTRSEEWITHVPAHPGPLLTHVAITWQEDGFLKYYENGRLVAEIASVALSRKVDETTSMAVYQEYLWLNELKLWNSALSDISAKNQHSTKNFTFDDGASLWTFENSSKRYTWQRSRNCTPSELTGPCGDHTYLRNLGTFIFAEASKPAELNDQALLISPSLPGCYRCLKFWYHMMGKKFGSLNIHFLTNTSKISSLDVPVLKIVGSGGNSWRYMETDLDVANVLRIVIEAKRSDSSKADIAVDDVMLTITSCKKECKPACEIGERCDPATLVCVYQGVYDHRWRLDSLKITDDKDSKHGEISGGVQLQDDGVFENCTELRGVASIVFRKIKRECSNVWCFPLYTLSFWLKYQEMPSQNIISFGELMKVTQSAPKEHISVEVNTAFRKCSTSVFVPPEVWAHVIVSVNVWEDTMSVYLDGEVVSNISRFVCTDHSEIQEKNEAILAAGAGSPGVQFALDDVRLLFDALEIAETVKSYKKTTGYGQSIFIQAEVKAETWNEELLDDESEKYLLLSQIIKTKIMETFENRSSIKDVIVERFRKGSVIADINILYDEVTYKEILLMEEAIHVDNTFSGLNINSYEFNSTSVPNVSPKILSAVSPNLTTVFLNWTEVTSLDLNGIFQGYKVLYRETENSTYTEYSVVTLYSNKTKFLFSDLDMFTNYTLRVLAFTLSGDGFISDSVTVVTLDGVPKPPNITVANVSSTSLYVNWTMLPNSTSFYKQLQGYHLLYWKESEKDKVNNMTMFPNEILLKNLEKWTEYCFNVTAYTFGNVGPTSETECAKTFEDVPETAPVNVTVVKINVTTVVLKWLPPPKSAVPGIVRYYNVSYRNLNGSSSEVTSLHVDSSTLTYAIKDLTGLSLVEFNISAFTVGSGPVHTLMVLTEEGVPLAAPNISCINVSSTSLRVSWPRIPNTFHNGILLGYHVYIWKQLEDSETARNVTLKLSDNHTRFNDLSKWTIYCTQVSGFTSVGSGPRSTEDCTRTFEDAPEAAPSSLTTFNVANTTVDIQWSPPPVQYVPGIIRRYNLTYRNLNYTDELLTERHFDPSERSYTMDNLICLTLYEVNVTATTILPGPWRTVYVLTLEGVPTIAPPNATWLNTSSTSLRLDWSVIPRPKVNGILLGYRVFIWKEAESPMSKRNFILPATANYTKIDNLEKYRRYCGQMEAFTRIGDGPRSPVECIRTSEDAVEIAPGPLNVSDIAWNECNLSWGHVNLSYVPGILRTYRVTYRIVDPRFDQSNTTFMVDSQFNSTVVTGLIGFVDYEIMVNGFTIKDGPLSISYFKTEEGVPTSPPAGLLDTEVTPSTISVAWQEILLPERHGIITGYQLTYKKFGERSKRDVEKTLTFEADTYKAFLFDLVPYTNYTISLRGRTSKGYGTPGEIIIETLQDAPTVPPKAFQGVNFTGPTSIYISWGSLSTAELQGALAGYEVIYQAFSVSDEELFNPPPEVVTIYPSNTNSILLTGLSTYTTYKVTIAAISGGGKGVVSQLLYVATCRCHKTLNTNFWQLQPYVNISGHNTDRGFFPHLLDMVTLYCCQHCLEHGTTDIDYFHDGEGRPSKKESDIDVKTNLTLNIDYSFPVYGFFGQTVYSKYYGFAAIVDVVGTVFFALKPDSSTVQANALLASIMSIMPFLAIAIIFAYIAGVIMWALEKGSNKDEFPSSFFRGAGSGFWWAYITMTTVGYGDKTARTLLGRIFAVVWVLMGLVIGSLLIGSIASAFTSSTSPPADSVKMLYGATVAALHDSPDHRLGVRRNAEVNKYRLLPDLKTPRRNQRLLENEVIAEFFNQLRGVFKSVKKYKSLQELRQALLSKKVDGILVDSYVSDANKPFFNDLSIKQVIDLGSSYGVVMGRDASKIKKCINKFWQENSATRVKFIEESSKPVQVVEVSTEEMMGETFSNEGDMYKLALYLCVTFLLVGMLCGCVYEVRRRKRRARKVTPEEPVENRDDLKEEVYEFLRKLNENIDKLLAKHRDEIITLSKWKRKFEKQGDKYAAERGKSAQNTGDKFTVEDVESAQNTGRDKLTVKRRKSAHCIEDKLTVERVKSAQNTGDKLTVERVKSAQNTGRDKVTVKRRKSAHCIEDKLTVERVKSAQNTGDKLTVEDVESAQNTVTGDKLTVEGVESAHRTDDNLTFKRGKSAHCIEDKYKERVELRKVKSAQPLTR